MYGLQDLVQDYGLCEFEKILFTYFGRRIFFVIIFDDQNVEAMLVDVYSDSSSYIYIYILTNY